jgi:hypothetical protein
MTWRGDIGVFVLPSPASELPSAPLSAFALMSTSGDQARSGSLLLLFLFWRWFSVHLLSVQKIV